MLILCSCCCTVHSTIPPIYCLMVTGKDDDIVRNKFARVSCINFYKQSYPNKHLIIINEGNLLVTDEVDKINVLEIKVKNKALGTMRNMALELVPPNAIWTTWDDDDWRSDTYLEVLFNKLNKNKTKRYLLYCNRIDYNMNTDFAYKVNIPTGTYIFFAYKDPFIQYDEINTREDAIVKKYILSKGAETIIYNDNDCMLYVRFIHKSNTSLFVDKYKTRLRVHSGNYVIEDKLNTRERNYVDSLKKNYNIM
jgi:hypothetical protein